MIHGVDFSKQFLVIMLFKVHHGCKNQHDQKLFLTLSKKIGKLVKVVIVNYTYIF